MITMAIARYNLKISCNGKVLIALPTTTKTDGHNCWTLPNDLMTGNDPISAVKELFAGLTGGLDIDSVAKNKLEYKQILDDDKVNYRTEVVVDHEFPASMAVCELTRYDKGSNMKIPKYVKFKWVPESELYYWLTRFYCRMEDIRISYFYPDNIRPRD